jgi:hypothetical protein
LNIEICEKKKEFYDFYEINDVESYLKNRKKAEIVKDLARYELIMRGFEQKGNILVKDKLNFNLELNKFVNKNGEEEKAVIEMNEGFLCKYTLRKLINFKAWEDDEHDIGIRLAKTFLETGLKVPEELFVGYYHKF